MEYCQNYVVKRRGCGLWRRGGGDAEQSGDAMEPEQATITVVDEPVAAPPVIAQERFVATMWLPDGVIGDGENLYLDDTDASRSDDNDSPFTAFNLDGETTVLGVVKPDEEDNKDFFLVELNAGQWLTLQATEPTVANADIFLYDMDMQLQTAGMGPAALEGVRVPESGRYYVEVAYATGIADGLVKYRLDFLPLGELPALNLQRAASFSIHDQLIPGQLIVTTIDHAGAVMPHTVAVAMDVDAPKVAVKGVAAKLAHGLPSRLLGQRHKNNLERRARIRNAAVRRGYDTLMHARALESVDGVLTVEPDQILYSSGLETVNDSDASKQWAAEMIDVEGAWPSSTGAGVTVAVLDTAFLPNHPDLQGQMEVGYDFVDGDDDVAASADLELHHGSHVAGIIAAARNNNGYIAGVAPDARLLPLRVMADCLCGSLGDILQALRYAAGLPNASGSLPRKQAEVANLSLQLPYGSNVALLQTLEEVTEAGTTVVWAAGNDSRRHSYDAAAVSGVPGMVIVSSVGSFQQLSSYSNYGSAVDLAAPGGDLAADNGARTVTSLNGYFVDGQWQYGTTRMQGSSQAAPFVAAVIALMYSVWPDITPAAVDSLIEDGRLSRDIGLPGNDDYYGAGLLDASRAVQTALVQVGGDISVLQPKRILATPSEANFGALLDALEVDIYSSNPNAPKLQLTYAPAWVAVSQLETTDGYGRWRIEVDRDRLGEASRSDVLRFSNAERQIVVPLSAHNRLASGRATGIAKLWLRFYDALNQRLVYQAYAEPDAARRFVLASDLVPAGLYLLRASTDLDGDGQYCELGELCAYAGGSPTAELRIGDSQSTQIELNLQLL
jgi:serine protease